MKIRFTWPDVAAAGFFAVVLAAACGGMSGFLYLAVSALMGGVR